MSIYDKLSLRQMLTLPYIILVLLLVGTIAILSFYSGRNAVNTLSTQLLTEVVDKITLSVENHISASEKALNAAFPKGVRVPDKLSLEMPDLRNRLWLATAIQTNPANYVYYGNESGQFYGLWRVDEDRAQIRFRKDGQSLRTLYMVDGIYASPSDPVEEKRIFEPRKRPWYQAVKTSMTAQWSPIYIDFKTLGLVTTLAKPVVDKQGQLKGVVATDLSLQNVDNFLKKLPLTLNGLAFIVDNNGDLVGASRGSYLERSENGKELRLNASKSPNPLLVAAYSKIRSFHNLTAAQTTRTGVFDDTRENTIHVAYRHLRDASGMDWTVIVAVPRSDFLMTIIENYRYTLVIALFSAIVVLAIGWSILSALSKELRNLSIAAKEIGEGQLNVSLETRRTDELGDLFKSFSLMQHKLLTDRLTGLLNREAIIRRIEDRIVYHRRHGDTKPFGVLFVDLNRFKMINDRYGHDVGDLVLQELAKRLLKSVRISDIVARYAGDEFIILLESVKNRYEVESARRNLEEELLKPIDFLPSQEEKDHNAGASVGVSVYPADGLDVESLIKHADQDMYQRKPDS